jgi:hypothetical protein
MKILFSFFFFAVLVCVPGLRAADVAAAAEPATPPAPSTASTKEMSLDEVEALLLKMDRDRQDLLTGQIKGLYGQLSPLLAQNALLVDAYKCAYEFVNFEGDAKEHVKAKEWEQKSKPMFQDDAFQFALKAHVQYLLASLMKRAGDDENAVKMTKEWLAAFPTAPDKFKELMRQEILTGGIANSVFLRASSQSYDFSTRRVMMGTGRGSSGASGQQVSLLQGIPNWYMGSLVDLPEIHRVNIIAYLRGKQDPRIFDEWKYNLTLEQQKSEREGLAVHREDFLLHRRPWLMWQVGRDQIAYGQPRQAVETMISVLKESPRCKDYDGIVADIRRAITEARKAGPEAVK